MTDLLPVFDAHRRLLFGVAYRMLGSVADAEDTVQDAWLRWSAADRGDVADPRAWLVRTTTRLALDRLTSARARRETYVGPWLPEPLLTDTSGDPADDAVLGEQVSMALLVVLESLSPAERAVFVLREVLALPVVEVAGVLGRSEAAVRQLAHRAREHVAARRPRSVAGRQEHREVTERFLAACLGGDVDALLSALAPGAVLITDGGGRAKAALRPITGADKVARFLAAVASGGAELPGLRMGLAEVNGRPGVAAWTDAGPYLAVSLGVSGGLVQQVLVVLNPDKLAGLGSGARLGSAG